MSDTVDIVVSEISRYPKYTYRSAQAQADNYVRSDIIRDSTFVFF